MFNEVLVKCPNCHAQTAVQSIGGTCSYTCYSLPEAMIEDVEAILDRPITCWKCRIVFKILTSVNRELRIV